MKSNKNKRSAGKLNRGRSEQKVSAPAATSARNKYLERAKEALLCGDRVDAENYFQHAEHFGRVLSNINANRESDNRPEKKKPTPAQTPTPSQAQSSTGTNTAQESKASSGASS